MWQEIRITCLSHVFTPTGLTRRINIVFSKGDSPIKTCEGVFKEYKSKDLQKCLLAYVENCAVAVTSDYKMGMHGGYHQARSRECEGTRGVCQAKDGMLMCEKCSALLKCGYNNGKGKPGARIRKIKQTKKDHAHKVLDVEVDLTKE